MKYVSLFSGIEAATVAFEPLGWEPMCFAEFDEALRAQASNSTKGQEPGI